jgi:hypothetical protein
MGQGMRGLALRAGVLVAAFGAMQADAQTSPQGAPQGVWSGEYLCGQGSTALELVLQPAKDAVTLRGWFHFQATPANPGVPEGCYEMTGSFDAPSGRISLIAGAWRRQPPGYITVDLKGAVDPGGTTLSGNVLHDSCTSFSLRLVRREAALPAACAAASSVTAPGVR